MPKIVITDVPGLDGEYEFDMNFTYRDFRTIKQVSGVRANEVMDALQAGDLDIIIALAEIALRRAGKVHSVDELLDADASTGSITLDVSDMEAEENPPPLEPELRSNDERTSSGNGTNGVTEDSPETLIREGSGTPQQVSTSAHLTSTT